VLVFEDIMNIILVLIGVIIILLILIFIAFKFGIKQGKYEKEIEWQQQLVKLKRDIAERQRAGVKGKISEAFAPFLQGFPFKASECKFIGDPIDYLIFEGLDERDIQAIHLVDVKADTSKLSKHQKQIKDIIDSLNSPFVRFHEFRFDSGISKEDDSE
jgi:predicted Holliday junction resolvase-like endonuclease